MTDITPKLLRELADDIEQRPDEMCWEYTYAFGSKSQFHPARKDDCPVS